MTINLRTLSVSAVAVGALSAGLFVAAGPASASGGGDGVKATGACSQRGTWKLTAKHDDSLIEVEYEVDTNVAGQTFHVRITDNGSVIAKRAVTTHGASGSFTVHKRAGDRSGADTIRAHAMSVGNTCGGVVHV